MNVIWKKYASARDIALQFFRDDPDDLADLNSMSDRGMEALTAEGEIEDVSAADYLFFMERQGYWGFCDFNDSQNPVVHYWHDGKRSLADLAFLLGHELGHSTGTPIDEDDSAEEDRANGYGLVASLVVARLLETEGLIVKGEDRASERGEVEPVVGQPDQPISKAE